MLHVIYGKDPYSMVREILEEMKPEKECNKDSLIALKPNLVLAKPSDSGATTSPQLARGVIEHFKEKGFFNLNIIESSWVGDSTERAFNVCGYKDLAREYNIELFDLKKDRGIKKKGDKLTLWVCKKALEVDYLINLPVLKAHCQTRLTCALKNIKGLIPDKEKRRFHQLGLHQPIAELNKIIKTHLVIVDAIMGDLSHEEGGNPVEMGRIIGGKDPVLVDSYAAELIGLRGQEVPYIMMSQELGTGSLFDGAVDIREYGLDNYPKVTLKPSSRVERLAKYIEEGGACSPCYGALIHALSRLEEEGQLKNITGKIFIGREYREEKEGREGKISPISLSSSQSQPQSPPPSSVSPSPALGVGLCTAGFERHISGCPPKARDIVEYLKSCNKP